MRVDWTGNKCLLCLREEPLTDEHIVPEALGGKLISKLLCQGCNSTLGASIEAKARSDPSVRIAVERLREQIPDLARRLMENQNFLANGPGPKTSGFIRGEEFRIKSQKHEDGSLLQPTDEARKSVDKILKKRGFEDSQILKSLRTFDEAPENQAVAVAPGLDIINWVTESIGLDLRNSKLMSTHIPLKIAFEFLACHLGTAVYDEAPQMNNIRQALKEGHENDACFRVERLNANDYKPFHGICFEGNHPHARVLIRLFGWLAFQVHFMKLSVGGPRFIYTHTLNDGKEHLQMLEEGNAP